jgi:hypothetical protein
MCLGLVDRIDFVPIMKTVEGQDEPVASNKFKQAFLYIDPRVKCVWSPEIISALEENRPYKIYPNRNETVAYLRDENEYWLILKNKSPVPYTNTALNIHQLANNNALLEGRVLELEQEIKKLKEEKDKIGLIALKQVNEYNYDEDAIFIEEDDEETRLDNETNDSVLPDYNDARIELLKSKYTKIGSETDTEYFDRIMRIINSTNNDDDIPIIEEHNEQQEDNSFIETLENILEMIENNVDDM